MPTPIMTGTWTEVDHHEELLVKGAPNRLPHDTARKPTCAAARASRLGVAMPVEEMVTTVSTSAAPMPAA